MALVCLGRSLQPLICCRERIQTGSLCQRKWKMPTNRSLRGGPTFSTNGSARPSASVAGQGVPGLPGAEFVAAAAGMTASVAVSARTMREGNGCGVFMDYLWADAKHRLDSLVAALFALTVRVH
jgi:hypothetical protein